MKRSRKKSRRSWPPTGRTREIWYILDALSGQNISEPVLLLYQREVRSNGKLGKLKQFSLRPYDIDRLVDRRRRGNLEAALGLSKPGRR